MQHPDEGTIHAWLDGALSAEEATAVEAHVKECVQCQASVGEARGFIAASSRILTALDNVPRGVVPAAQPKRRIAPWVWRVAATVLVVAAGTLVVVRRTGVNQALPANTTFQVVQRVNDSSRSSESAASTIAASPASPMVAPLNQGTEPPKVSPRAASPIVRNRPADAAAASSVLRADREQNQKTSIAAGSASVAERSAVAAAPATPPAPSLAAPQRFGVAGNLAGSKAASAADMAVTLDESDLRTVGNRRAIGQKITMYEIAPGDTVELAEQTQAQLEQVVTTGMSDTRMMAAQGKAPTTARATAKASAPATDAALPAAASVGAVTTISWKDSTGRVIKLSGRHTAAELEQIRQRIEQSRAAARVDSLKKNR
jgi:hypothetical protein